MNVDNARGEKVDDTLRDDLAVADENTGWRAKGANIVGDFDELFWLPDRNVVFFGEDFNAWRREFLAATFFAVGFCNDGCNRIPCVNQAGEGGEAEILSPKEYDWI